MQIILTADWHIREKPPICRTDDFESALWRKIDFISELSEKYNSPVIIAGDLFHSANVISAPVKALEIYKISEDKYYESKKHT